MARVVLSLIEGSDVGASSLLIPAIERSYIHEMTRAIGKPISRTISRKRDVQEASSRIGEITSATCSNNQATTTYTPANRCTLRRFISSINFIIVILFAPRSALCGIYLERQNIAPFHFRVVVSSFVRPMEDEPNTG